MKLAIFAVSVLVFASPGAMAADPGTSPAGIQKFHVAVQVGETSWLTSAKDKTSIVEYLRIHPADDAFYRKFSKVYQSPKVQAALKRMKTALSPGCEREIDAKTSGQASQIGDLTLLFEKLFYPAHQRIRFRYFITVPTVREGEDSTYNLSSSPRVFLTDTHGDYDPYDRYSGELLFPYYNDKTVTADLLDSIDAARKQILGSCRILDQRTRQERKDREDPAYAPISNASPAGTSAGEAGTASGL